jgi:hypothetical protein
MMVRGDWRILRRARDFRSYTVEKKNPSTGNWTTFSGPWFCMSNAKCDMLARVSRGY